MLDFRPPKDSPAFIGFAKLTWPLFLKYALHDTRVKPIDGALERFKKAAHQRGMICPNHANKDDPMVIFELSRLVNENFNYIAAREVFDWHHGINGWLLQHSGAFSVVRGACDRESFKTSRQIIANGKKKLVLFPEGELSRQNETVMPMETGAAQLCFWAIDELAKQTSSDIDSKPVYLIPTALRYTFPKDVRPTLLDRLSDLEKRLNLAAVKQNALERLKIVSEKVLTNMEQEFNFKPDLNTGLGERAVALRSHVVKTVAEQLNISLPANEPLLSWIRTVRNTMDDLVFADNSVLSEYQKRINEEKGRIIRRMYRHLDRVVNFISIYQGYLAELNTQEHFSDLLERLETEVLGHDSSCIGARVVYLNVAEPINMTALYPEYKENKKKTVATLTDQLANQISSMVTELDKLRTPILVD